MGIAFFMAEERLVNLRLDHVIEFCMMLRLLVWRKGRKEMQQGISQLASNKSMNAFSITVR